MREGRRERKTTGCAGMERTRHRMSNETSFLLYISHLCRSPIDALMRSVVVNKVQSFSKVCGACGVLEVVRIDREIGHAEIVTKLPITALYY